MLIDAIELVLLMNADLLLLHHTKFFYSYGDWESPHLLQIDIKLMF